jgi:hypothetical protein
MLKKAPMLWFGSSREHLRDSIQFLCSPLWCHQLLRLSRHTVDAEVDATTRHARQAVGS